MPEMLVHGSRSTERRRAKESRDRSQEALSQPGPEQQENPERIEEEGLARRLPAGSRTAVGPTKCRQENARHAIGCLSPSKARLYLPNRWISSRCGPADPGLPRSIPSGARSLPRIRGVAQI